MSTFVGQSEAHALHERQRSRASRTSVLRQLAGVRSAWNISASTLARPRVEWTSSRVARYEGHMVAASSRLQRPTPTQRIEACISEPSSLSKEYPVGRRLTGSLTVANRMFESRG